jgi:hypothetical protein
LTKLQILVVFVLLFLALEIILNLIGLINLDPNEIFGNGFVLYGILSAGISFRNQKKGILFVGSVSFLGGIILFIISSFDLVNTNSIVFPAFMFIFSAAFFMLFLDDLKNKVFLTVALVFFASGLVSTIFIGSISTFSFFNAIGEIIVRYWVVELIIILAMILLSVIKENR